MLTEPFSSTGDAGEGPCTPKRDPAGSDIYSFKGVFVLGAAQLLAAAPQTGVWPILKGELASLIANSSDAAWGLRAQPPWAAAPADVCADPALGPLQQGPPKFPWFWAFEPPSQQPQRVCRDARSQISALSLFCAHLLSA